MRPVVQRQHIDAGLDLGMQRRVVGAQQRHQEEQAMRVFQEQLALAGLLAPFLQGHTVAVDRRGVVPGQEPQRRLRGLAQRRVGLLQCRQRAANVVEAQRQHIMLQQRPPHRGKVRDGPAARDTARSGPPCRGSTE